MPKAIPDAEGFKFCSGQTRTMNPSMYTSIKQEQGEVLDSTRD